MEVEANRRFELVAGDDINGCIRWNLWLVGLGEGGLGQDAGHFKVTFDEALDDLIALSDKQSGLPRQVALAEVAIAGEAWIIDRRDWDQRHQAPARMGTTKRWSSPPVT